MLYFVVEIRKPADMIARARRLRRNMSDAEALLWSELRGRRLASTKFRRQHPIGPYIGDFVCYRPKIIIELDGGQHEGEDISANDHARTKWLEAKGFRVLRFWNNDVLEKTDDVLGIIFSEVVDGSRCPKQLFARN